MKKGIVGIFVACGVCISALWAQGATINLYDYAFNVEGTVSKPASIPGFDGSGLGTFSINVTGEGDHYIAAFFDYEIDEADNTFYNEYGAPVNSPSGVQSWEIDEPGFVYGDIYANFSAGTLDNFNGVPELTPDDVSMAMGWNFNLEEGQSATITMSVSDTLPEAGFYLCQTDPDSQTSIYFSSSFAIVDHPNGVPDVCSTLALFACGMAGLTGLRKRIQL